MARKPAFSFEIKIDIVERYLAGKTTISHEAKLLGVSRGTIIEWVSGYKCMGENGLITTSQNTVYSVATKQNAAEDYLNGKGSYLEICRKYKIRSTTQLKSWIKKYNGHEELKASRSGGKPIMTNGRKTTYKERIAIVQYCIENQNNYSETADKFKVSY